MPRKKTDREIVTHDELIRLYKECKQMKCGPPNIANACKCRLESKFKTAIAEARGMGVLTLTLLIDLRDLRDPSSESKELICPSSIWGYLDRTIEHYVAIEKKRRGPIFQQVTE